MLGPSTAAAQREATLRNRLEEDRQEIERLEQLLVIARGAVREAATRARTHGRIGLATAYEDALRRSDPDATHVAAATDG